MALDSPPVLFLVSVLLTGRVTVEFVHFLKAGTSPLATLSAVWLSLLVYLCVSCASFLHVAPV